MINQTFDASSAFILNYSILSNSCFGGQLSLPVDRFDMIVHGVNPNSIEFRHETLRQPDRFVLEQQDPDTTGPVLGLKDHNLHTWIWEKAIHQRLDNFYFRML